MKWWHFWKKDSKISYTVEILVALFRRPGNFLENFFEILKSTTIWVFVNYSTKIFFGRPWILVAGV